MVSYGLLTCRGVLVRGRTHQSSPSNSPSHYKQPLLPLKVNGKL